MPTRPVALLIGLLSVVASVGSSLWAWLMDNYSRHYMTFTKRGTRWDTTES